MKNSLDSFGDLFDCKMVILSSLLFSSSVAAVSKDVDNKSKFSLVSVSNAVSKPTNTPPFDTNVFKASMPVSPSTYEKLE